MASDTDKIYGVLAEFGSPGDLLEAAKRVHSEGFKKFDCHSPFPIHGMDAAMGLSRSPLAKIVAIVAFFATCGGLFLQYWTNAVDYPLVISGKPLISYQAYAPVGFGIAVLISALTAFLGMLVLNNLPKLFHPVFHSDRFKKFSDDGFFMSIEAGDNLFDRQKTAALLESIGAYNVEVLKNS
ncbi:DUF3341 domain-containing protein [candidate division KSB1 bacterium]